MKRFVLCLLSLCLLLAPLCSCTRKAEREEDTRPVIVASIFPLYDFSRALLGDAVRCELLLPPGADLHSYEPTPKDLALISECDLFLYIGGHDDEHVESLLASMPQVQTMTFLDRLDLDCSEEAIHHQHQDEHSHIDEHVWTSPVLAMQMVEELKQEFTRRFSELSDTINANALDYQSSLSDLDANFRTLSTENVHLIFGDSFPFSHLTHEYNLSYTAAIHGCAEDSEPSAATIGNIITLMKECDLHTVFYTETSDGKVARAIAEDTSAVCVRLHSCHNLNEEDLAQGETYLSLMQSNYKSMRAAFAPEH